MENRFCVFGDSLSSDEYGCPISWVSLLKEFLNSGNEDNPMFNLSISGESTSHLLNRISNECEARCPSVIIIRIGANDARYNDRTEDTVETPIKVFESNVKKIIEACKKYTDSIVFVGNLPVIESKTTPVFWSDKQHFLNRSIRLYNDTMKSVCENECVMFIDLFSQWCKMEYGSLMLEDGLHPNQKGHQKLFEDIKDYLIENKIIDVI